MPDWWWFLLGYSACSVVEFADQVYLRRRRLRAERSDDGE